MKLVHYSKKPLVELHNNHSDNCGAYKPRGLWVSVEGEGMFGWRDWCEQNEWGVEGLVYATEIELIDPARALHITDSVELLRFDADYRIARTAPSFFGTRHGEIDWPRVASRHAGLIIAPYIWERRLDVTWYYGWDCASGVFWDTSCLRIGKNEV